MTVINNTWLQENKNEFEQVSLWSRLVGYTCRTDGSYRTLKIAQNSAKLSKLPELDHRLGMGANALSVPRLFPATSGMIKSLSSLKNDPDISFFRRAVKAVRDTMDAIAAYGYASIFITGNMFLRPVAQATEVVTDLADLHISASDYSQAAELESKASGEAKVALEHTRKHNFIRTMKAAASIAIAILSFALVVTGLVLPIVALTIAFLSVTMLAVARDLHKDWGRYKIINFDRTILLEV